jgi:hypothetical protein
MTKMRQARAYRKKELMLEKSMICFFLYRSTSDPRKNPERATVNVYTPAMTEVAITDLVCRYTQKVTANHTKKFVIEAAIELANMA